MIESQPSNVPPMAPPDRRKPWMVFLGIWVLLGCLDLTLYSWRLPPNVSDQVSEYLFRLKLGFLPTGMLILYAPYFVAVALVLKGGLSNLRPILGFAILFRLALLPGFPILETDFYRYLWDGRMVNSGHNPYRYSPREIEIALAPTLVREDLGEPLASIVEEVRNDPLHRSILAGINNKSVPTLYFPTAQYLFAVGDLLATGVLSPTGGPEIDRPRLAEKATVVWKFVLFPFELGIVFLIVSLLRRVGGNPSWVILYAWSPLVLKEYGNTGHYDPLVVFLLLLGLRLAFEIPLRPGVESAEAKRARKFRVLSGAAFGAAIGCKAFPLLILPFLWTRLRSLGVGIAAGVLVLLYLPFLGVGTRLFTGLATYSQRWEFNSGLVAFNEWWISRAQDLWAGLPAPDLLKGDGEPNPLFTWSGVEFSLDAFFLAKALSGSILLAILIRLSWASLTAGSSTGAPEDSPLRAMRHSYLVIGALLLLSPVTDPWYVCWIVPFLCFFPSPAWLYLTFSQQVYYLYFWNDWKYVRFSDLPWLGVDSDWEVARPLEYIPFYLLLLWGWRRSRSRCAHS